jgi:3-hydroxyisobutyrate dehydrogenase-like beta-hydroxyacid dehydrogenase
MSEMDCATALRVGFIGLGDQGGPMARMIGAEGFDIGIWARRQSVAADYAARGMRIASSPAHLAAGSDLMCLCVTGDEDVRELAIDRGIIAAMGKDTMLAIHSTIRPSTCVELAGIAARHGVILLDMPVSGSGHAALARNLLVMAGGDRWAIARAMPVLECYGGTILRMGDVGTAMSAKLINNLMAVVNIGQAWGALLLGRRMGVEPPALREALMVGTGRTFAIDLVKRLQRPERADHVLRILRKDVDLALCAMPEEEAQHWQPLTQAGLAALERLVMGKDILIPLKEEYDGEYVVHGNA